MQPILLASHTLRRLLACGLAAWPLYLVTPPARAQEGPVCATSAPLGAEACAKWVCMQHGRCQVIQQIGREKIETCPPACTPGESEYVTVYGYVWTDGCLQLACIAKQMPDCPKGSRRIGGNCVFDQQRQKRPQSSYRQHRRPRCSYASRNRATASTRLPACDFSVSAAAGVCSTNAEFCCAAPSSEVIAWLCRKPCPCCSLAPLISAISVLTDLTLVTRSPMERPASSTSLLPLSTFTTLAPIRLLISRAASALRCARPRTSDATTAKPRPASPARAASTAAFNARMLVWTQWSRLLMMSLILDALSLISVIVRTTATTTSRRGTPQR